MIIIDCKNQKIESCLKKYRQKAERIGQVKELRSRQRYEKPSVKKRDLILKAKYKTAKYGDSQL